MRFKNCWNEELISIKYVIEEYALSSDELRMDKEFVDDLGMLFKNKITIRKLK